MASTWIDYAVVTAVVIIGLFILYRALKEPMDLLFGALGKGLGKIRDLFTGGDSGGVGEVITYG